MSSTRSTGPPATPALHERELARATHLVEVLAGALQERGLAPGRALLAAQVGLAAITRATRPGTPSPLARLGSRAR